MALLLFIYTGLGQRCKRVSLKQRVLQPAFQQPYYCQPISCLSGSQGRAQHFTHQAPHDRLRLTKVHRRRARAQFHLHSHLSGEHQIERAPNLAETTLPEQVQQDVPTGFQREGGWRRVRDRLGTGSPKLGIWQTTYESTLQTVRERLGLQPTPRQGACGSRPMCHPILAAHAYPPKLRGSRTFR